MSQKCKFTYKGKIFDTEKQLVEFVKEQEYKNTNTPLEIYKNEKSKKLQDKINPLDKNNDILFYKQTKEPRVYYKVNDILFKDYRSALIFADKNGINNISVGHIVSGDAVKVKNVSEYNTFNNDVVVFGDKVKVNSKDAFLSLSDIKLSTDLSSREGFLNYAISNNLINGNMEKIDDDYYLTGYGRQSSFRVFNGVLFTTEFNKFLGDNYDLKSFGDGSYQIVEKESDLLVDKEGNSLIVNDEVIKNALKDGKFLELKNKYPNFIQALYKIWRRGINLFDKKIKISNTNKVDKDELKFKLLNILDRLGVSVISISDYLETYGKRHGNDISVEALADISNQVVALAEGKETLENLTEETMHFIVEAIVNQSGLNDDIINEIVNTDEWQEYSKQYYDKYSQEGYEGDELDTLVKREIVGKLLKNILLNKVVKTDSTRNLIDRLKDLFNRFLDIIRSKFNPELKNNLQSVLDTIADDILNDNISDYLDKKQLKESTFVMYSLNDKRTLATLLKLKQRLEGRLAHLKSSKSPDARRVETELNKLNNAINNNDEWFAITNIISGVETDIKRVKTILDSYKENKENDVNYFSQDEKSLFNALLNDYAPILKEIRSLITNGYVTNNELIDTNKILNRIDNSIKNISILEVEDKIQSQNDINTIYKKLIKEFQLPESAEKEIEALLTSEMKDISWLQSNFGQLEHANNIFLNMLGKMIANNNFKANEKLLKLATPFIKYAESKGYRVNDWRRLIEKDENGNTTRWTKSPYMWAKFKQAELEAMVTAYNTATGSSYDVKGYQKALKRGEIKKKSELTREELQAYNDYMDNWYNDNTERRYIKEWYEKRKKLYKDLDIRSETQEFLSNLSSERYFILKKYIKPGRQLDYSKISERDRQALKDISLMRKSARSIIDAETGLEKQGIDRIISEDLTKLDEHYKNERKSDYKLKDSFFDTLMQIEKEKGNKEALKWLYTNGGLGFNDEFWGDIIDNNKASLIDRLNAIKDKISDNYDNLDDYETLDRIIPELERLLSIKKNILKQFVTPNNPAEIDFDAMSGNTIEVLKDTETQLKDIFRTVNRIVKEYDDSSVENETDKLLFTENTTNLAYEKALSDSNKEELEFIKEHVTDSDAVSIDNFKRGLLNIFKGRDRVPLPIQKFFEIKYGLDEVSADYIRETYLNDKTDIDKISIEYGKTKLLPYFKRFAPAGYNEFINNLENGEYSIIDIVNKINNKEQTNSVLDYLRLNTQFSWVESSDGEEYKNPNYDENFEGGYRQPKIDKYLNDDFFNEFGINKEEWKKSRKLTATRNTEHFEMLQKLWDIKSKAIKLYNESGNESIYKLPQISQGTYQRLGNTLSLKSGETLANTLKDIIYNRVDDLLYGEQIEGKDTYEYDTRLIPKYFLRDLEETSDISHELLHSYTVLLKSALEYDAKLNSVKEALVLEQSLLDANFVGKSADNTRAYEMFKNFMDAYFFGKRLSKKFVINVLGHQVDISKMAVLFDKMVRMVNIGFSIPIALTSLTTSLIFRKIEGYVGEHIHKTSVKWADKELGKLAGGYINEIGQVNRKSKLYLIKEKFRLHDIAERTKSSGYNRIMRAMNDLPYAFSEVGAFPVVNTVILSILDDNRLVGDKIIDYNAFKKLPENIGKSDKELTKIWDEKYRDKSVYNMLELDEDKGYIDFKQEYKDLLGEEYLSGVVSKLSTKAISVDGNIDAIVPMEDKAAATRHFIMRYMTAHRSWLALAIQRKFKGKHFNFRTGEYEKGHYISVTDYVANIKSKLSEKKMTELISIMKEEYNALDETDKRNLKRVFAEFTAYMLLVAIGFAVAGIADTPDNKDIWALQFSAYIYFRTENELGSNQAPTGILGMVDVVKTPFIAINTLQTILDYNTYSLEEVKSGAYKGHSKLFKKLAKITWLRHYYGLQDIRSKSNYYRLLNSETLIGISKHKHKNKNKK